MVLLVTNCKRLISYLCGVVILALVLNDSQVSALSGHFIGCFDVWDGFSPPTSSLSVFFSPTQQIVVNVPNCLFWCTFYRRKYYALRSYSEDGGNYLECMCGDTLPQRGFLFLLLECSKPCTDESDTWCFIPDRLTVYRIGEANSSTIPKSNVSSVASSTSTSTTTSSITSSTTSSTTTTTSRASTTTTTITTPRTTTTKAVSTPSTRGSTTIKASTSPAAAGSVLQYKTTQEQTGNTDTVTSYPVTPSQLPAASGDSENEFLTPYAAAGVAVGAALLIAIIILIIVLARRKQGSRNSGKKDFEDYMGTVPRGPVVMRTKSHRTLDDINNKKVSKLSQYGQKPLSRGSFALGLPFPKERATSSDFQKTEPNLILRRNEIRPASGYKDPYYLESMTSSYRSSMFDVAQFDYVNDNDISTMDKDFTFRPSVVIPDTRGSEVRERYPNIPEEDSAGSDVTTSARNSGSDVDIVDNVVYSDDYKERRETPFYMNLSSPKINELQAEGEVLY